MHGLSIELNWVGFDMDWMGMDWIGLHWISFGLDLIGVRLHWNGLGMDYIGLDCSSFFELWMVLVAQNGLLGKIPAIFLAFWTGWGWIGVASQLA